MPQVEMFQVGSHLRQCYLACGAWWTCECWANAWPGILTSDFPACGATVFPPFGCLQWNLIFINRSILEIEPTDLYRPLWKSINQWNMTRGAPLIQKSDCRIPPCLAEANPWCQARGERFTCWWRMVADNRILHPHNQHASIHMIIDAKLL